MAVVNKIAKIRKRSHALVAFDQGRIARAISRAATSVGGFGQDYIPEINDRVFAAGGTEDGIAEFLSDLRLLLL